VPDIARHVGAFTVELTLRPGVPRLLPAGECRRLVAAALAEAGAPAGATVSLTLGDDAELARLNAEHMGQDGATDVLSFPLLPVAAFPRHPGHDAQPVGPGDTPRFVLPPGEPVHLGDVIVSVERAVAQADAGRGGQTGDVGWSPADELRLLITHGTLHLCGWNHAAPDEEAAMRALERRLLGSS
jgi:probable rRNA maturation factor